MDKQTKISTSHQNDVPVNKRIYTTPMLRNYGKVKNLTTGGSGNAIENQQGQGNPTYRP